MDWVFILNELALLVCYGTILVLITFFVIRFLTRMYIFFGLGILVFAWRSYIFGVFLHSFSPSLSEFLNGSITRYPTYILSIALICYSIYLINKHRENMKKNIPDNYNELEGDDDDCD